jgi:hypothetical protein
MPNLLRVIWIINKKNLAQEYIHKSEAFAASVLDKAAPLTFFGAFGFRPGKE